MALTKLVSSRGVAVDGAGATKSAKLKKTAAISEEDDDIEFEVSVERWRMYAYSFFWFMCFFAIAINKALVRPILLAGPTNEALATCPPFERDDPVFGVSPGEGFDVDTHSHLHHAFGFANICVNWDYSPSRELTAMVYPTFEYSLLVYLVFDFMATTIANKRGELSSWFWIFSKIAFPINIFLCAQFRMIFVCIAYENVNRHTAGFLGLQICLILVALQNSGFAFETQTAYNFLGGGDDFALKLKRTRQAIIVYLICMLSISIIKVLTTVSVVTSGALPDWVLVDSAIVPGMNVAQVVDLVWMVFNAVIPLFLAYFRSKEDEPLKFHISQEQLYAFEDESGAGGDDPASTGTAA